MSTPCTSLPAILASTNIRRAIESTTSLVAHLPLEHRLLKELQRRVIDPVDALIHACLRRANTRSLSPSLSETLWLRTGGFGS